MSYYYKTATAYPAQSAPVQMNQVTSAGGQAIPAAMTSKPSWSWLSTGCSIFSMFCCFAFILSPVFSLLGLVFNMASYSDHKSGDYQGSKYKKKWAWGCTILAIVLGLVCIIVITALAYLMPEIFGTVINILPF